MAKQEIDIGIQGNDGTGDSIRDSFRKVNENFNEIYSIFGAGGTIDFTALGDTPDSYTLGQIFITGNTDGQLGILAKTLEGAGSVTIDNSAAGTLTIRGSSAEVFADKKPRLGGPLDANNIAIGNIPNPSPALVTAFNAAYAANGISTTIDKLPINKGYADASYVGKSAGNVVSGALKLRDEPLFADFTDPSYDPTLTGNYLSNEALPRKSVVYRGGDSMTGSLFLNDHPSPLAGAGTPTGADDLQAATKFYVDNEVYVSATNLYVRTDGDDTQFNSPPGREGRNWAHAYKTISAAALQAENLINLASLEPGPYRQKISYTISPNQFNSTITSATLSGGNSAQPGYIDAAELLRINKAFIQAETIAYINNKYVNSFTYDQAKCQRDVQIILNAVATDLVISSNFNSLQAATSYFESQAESVINSQLVQTIDGINYAKQQILEFSYNSVNLNSYIGQVIDALNYDMAFQSNYQSVIMARYFPEAGTGLSVTEIVGTLGELRTLLTNLAFINSNPIDAAVTSLTNNINAMIVMVQGGLEPTVVMPKLASTSVAKQSARSLLLNNIGFIQSEIIAWITANYPNVSYSQAKCKRDVGYIVESIAYDQLYGGNSRTLNAGQRYWDNNTRQIAPSELSATKGALAYVGVLAQAVINNSSPALVYQTAVIQYQNQTFVNGAQRTDAVLNLVALVAGATFNISATSTIGNVITTTSTKNMTVGMPLVMDQVSVITSVGFQVKTGTGPYYITMLIPLQATAPLVNSAFTVAGNPNTNYNGTYTVFASTTQSVTLTYPTDPGVYSSGAPTTLTPFLGNIVAGERYYLTEVVSNTQFRISASLGGSTFSLANSVVNIKTTFAGLISENVSPLRTEPTLTDAIASLQTVWGLINTAKPATVTAISTFVNTTYPYINNPAAIVKLGELFQVVTDTLTFGLANRQLAVMNTPSSLPTSYVNASKCMLLNTSFIAAETIGYLKTQNPGFNYVDLNGQIRFEKEIQLLVEAVTYDITYGGTSASTLAADQYWVGTTLAGTTTFASTIDNAEKTIKLDAIAKAKSIAATVASNTAPPTLYQDALNYDATFIRKTQVGSNYNVVLGIPQRIIPITVGSNVVISNQSTVAFNGSYTVVASSADSVTLQYLSDPGTWSILTATKFVIAQNINVSFNGGSAASDDITAKWDLIGTIIDTNPPNLVEISPDLTNSAYAGTGYVAVKATINTNAVDVSQMTTAYLDGRYRGGFSYNEATCRRDIGYIIDAMRIDLLTGGTYQSINAGKSYYKNASAKAIAIGTQYTETIDGIIYARTVALQVLNQVLASRFQNILGQITDGSKNASSGYSSTATWVSGTGTSIVVSGISGDSIVAGMTVTGTGFTGGQTVISVNGNNITLSAAPNGTPSGTLSFNITAITTFTANYNTMLNIVTTGFGAAPQASFGTGIYTIAFTNGGNGYVDQCPPGDFNILPGKILQGNVSGATANILSYSQGLSNNVDTVTCQLLQPGFFVENEELEYAESVGALNVLIHVETGVYEEDYPIRLASSVSIKGEEFRRTIIRPKDRISQSPWRSIFFYRDAVIDAMQLGEVDDATDYVPDTNITSFASKVSVGGGLYHVTFNIPTQTFTPSTSIQYTIAGNENLAYNGRFHSVASTNNTITIQYLTDPGVYSTGTITTINPIVSATISSTIGKITITLSSNSQASVQWLGYVFQSDVLDSNGKPGRAVIDSVSGNFMNATVMYPFTQTGTLTISYLNAFTFEVGETITQSSSSNVSTGVVLSVGPTSISYKVTSGNMSTVNGAVVGNTSGASAAVTATSLGTISPTGWHLYTTKNYGRHYLTDPQDPLSTPKNNKEIDVFLCGNAVRVNNLTMQGHGGFSMVLDPESQIKSKSPYGQVCSSFSRSVNKQTFAGGQFVDGFTGRLFGQITAASLDGFTLTVTGGINSGLDVRAPQTPTAFFVRGGRYQINTVSNYTQIFDVNGNVIGGTVQLNLGAATPWREGPGQRINIEMAGNKSMLANDFAMINDLGYAILATNGGLTEQVSTFTYYCWTSFWALNGGQIRSIGSSSAHGQYALRATGYDVTEKPDSVELAQNLMQVARIYNPAPTLGVVGGNPFYGTMIPGANSVYIYGYDYYPTQITELEIDHSLAGKGLVRYQVNSISHTAVNVDTGSAGSNYKFASTTYTASGSSGTTLKVASTTGIVVGMTVTGVGFTRDQRVVSISLDGITLVLNGAPDSTPVNGQTLWFSDTVVLSGAVLGGVSSQFTGNTVNGVNTISNVSSLISVRTSPALLVTGFVSKTGTGPFLVTFNIPTQPASPTVTTGYTVSGCTNANYNGTFECTFSTTTTIVIKYTSDPGVFNLTNSTVIMPPATATATYTSKSGSAPDVLVTYTIASVATAPLVGGSFTISGNTNTNYNGTYFCTASTTTSLTLRYTTDPGTSGGSATVYQFNGSTIIGANLPFETTALAAFGGNTIVLSTPATLTAAGSNFSSNAGNDITAYVTGLVNTAVSAFTFKGVAVLGGSGSYSNLISQFSSGRGVYASFNVTVASGVYTSVTVGGQNVLLLTLSTSGNGGTSSTGLAAGLYDGQMVQLRTLQNFKFYEIDNVNPTRPSTAVQFTDNLGAIYRVLSYNLTEATNEILPQFQAILSTDQSYSYYLLQADTGNITKPDPIDGGSKTLGATPGDTRIAVTTFGPQSSIDQLNKGTYAFAFGGKVHTVASYTPPVVTSAVTGYNPTGSSGTTLVIGGTFVGTLNSTATISSIVLFTGLVIGEPIRGFGIPANTTIISINQAAGTIGISAAATATAGSVTLTYGDATSILVGMGINGTGFTNQKVAAIVANTISSVAIADTAGTLTVTSGTYIVGQSVTVTGSLSAGSISGYTTGTIYYIGKVNSLTSIQITSTYVKATAAVPVFDVVTTVGTATPGATFTLPSNTVTLDLAPASTPSGTLVFSIASVPYVTLGATKFNITSTDSTPITISRIQSRGQFVADFVPSGYVTGNITTGSTSILGVSTLTGLGAGTSLAGAGINSIQVVTATSSTSPSTITLDSAANVSVGNLITFQPTSVKFGNIPQVGSLIAGTTTFSGATGTASASAATYTGVKAKRGSGLGSGAVFTVVKTGALTAYSDANTTITVTSGGVNYSPGDTVTLSGLQLGLTDGVNDLTFTIGGSVAQANYYVRSVSGNDITIANTLGGTALTTITSGTGSMIARTDNLIVSTTAQTQFTANAAIGSPILTSVSSFTNLVVGKPVSGIGIGAGSVIQSLDTGASTITLSVNCVSNQTGTTVTCITNTVVLSAPATATTTGQGLTFNNLSTTINVYTSSATAGIVAGMTLFGNGFQRGQTVISAKALTSGDPYTEIVLSAVPDSRPFGRISFTTLSSVAGPWYENFVLPTQTSAPVVDSFVSVLGNTNTNYNKFVPVIASSLEGVTLAYTVDPHKTKVVTYNPSGSTIVFNSGTGQFDVIVKVSNNSGIVPGMIIRGGGAGGFWANQSVIAVDIDGVSLTVSSSPSGIPSGNLTFTLPYGANSVVAYATTTTTNYVSLSTTNGLTIGSALTFTGTGFGGLSAGTYYITAFANDTQVTLSTSPSGSTVPLSTATGTLTATITTTITPITTGIARPMSVLLATPLRVGYQAGTGAQITTRISTCRATAHDLLDIGTGGYNTTNYPYQIYGNPFQKAKQEFEIVEETVGRVFYVTTDQNGIFRVGRFFTVDQGTGTVTFSASIALSNLDGLGFKRGVTISEFSTDSTMTNDASDTVPTQSAVRAYIDNRLGLQHSGANTSASSLIGPGFMALSGQLPMKGNMSMGGFAIGSLALPILSTDATNKLYVDTTVNDTDSLFKVKDTARRMGASTVTGNVLVYSSTTTNNALSLGAWTNASYDPATSDLRLDWDGTLLAGKVQGSYVTVPYSAGGTSVVSGTFDGVIENNVLTVENPTITVVKGMRLTGGTVQADTFILDGKTGIGGAGTYVVSKFQTSTCTGGSTIPLTVSSTVGILPGMTITGTGFVGGQVVTGVVNSTIVNISAIASTTPNNYITFTRDGVITDRKVFSNAGILQSKLGLTLASAVINTVPTLTTVNATALVVGKRYRILTIGSSDFRAAGSQANTIGTIFQATGVTTGSGTATDLDVLQAAAGVSQYDSDMFTVTDGWVTLRTASSATNGLPITKIRWVGANTVLANTTGSPAAVVAVSTESMVANGDGIRNQDIPGTFAPGVVGSPTGVVVRTGSKAYDCFPITTSGGNNSILRTTGVGIIDVKGVQLNSFPTTAGAAIFKLGDVETTTVEFYTPGNIKFMKSTGSSSSDTTYYSVHDFSSDGALLKSKTLSTGAFGTAGTVTGQWSLSAGSEFDFSTGLLKTRTITTGSEALDCAMTGTFTLTGSSKLQATYAGDLAEYYEGDAEYEPGTVLVFGGDKEVTTTDAMNDTRVAGVVSTDAAYMMYGACPGLKNLVALAGRVPCKVVGRVKKGDLLTTSSTPGYAVKANDPKLGSIIGKALQDKDSGEAGIIEVAIGRL